MFTSSMRSGVINFSPVKLAYIFCYLLVEDALTKEEKVLLNSILNELKSKIEKSPLIVDDVVREFQDEVRHRLFAHIISSKDEDIVAKRSYYLTLVSLVCVDYISACKRRGKETRFGEVMEEFYKLYFSAVKGVV